jgi:hypothetical protein
MKIRFDGKDYDLTKPDESAAFQAAVTDFAAKHATATAKAEARADAADVEIKKLKEQVADTTRLDSLVSERVALNTAATRVLGAEYDTNKTPREIMLDVIRADDSDFTGKDSAGKERSEDYIRARFDAVVESGTRADSINSAPKVIRDAREDEDDEFREDGDEDSGSAYAAMVKRNRTAWQSPAPAAAEGN